ncbi:hypothetical protein [Methanoculleus chikugoensis]|uniref:hypothetical protein n=1 Tax=Methanoculleus chikugoensis TaxID=118126 RepID=UPI001FB2E922|nr:hypothetical protein [Methanoculleus chikugoensis]
MEPDAGEDIMKVLVRTPPDGLKRSGKSTPNGSSPATSWTTARSSSNSGTNSRTTTIWRSASTTER